MKKTVVIEAKRTPIGSFQGTLSSLSATKLGSIVIKDLIDSTQLPKDSIDEVIMGNVLTAGVGQAPARQASLFAGLSEKTECMTINKVCGSGLKSIMLAHQAIQCGDADIVIAGGMESMSNTPYLLQDARNGYRLGHGKLIDSMINDGLWDIYNNIHMGNCAEDCARKMTISREEVDSFAIESYKRAIDAQKSNKFSDEITKVKIEAKKETQIITDDEEPKKVKFEKIPELKPAFDKEGIITAANASKINDGAAAVLLMSEEKANAFGYKPSYEIFAQASAAKLPIEFSTAPADVIKKILGKASLNLDDIELFEINEAFAVVSVAVNKLLNLNTSKVNVNGGAIALGHPIGASGARIFTTLYHEMKRKKYKLGIAALCIGGGEASSIILKKYEG